MNVNITELMQDSGVKFGTSGTRGLVKDMTDYVCFAYTAAFLQHLLDKNWIQPGDTIGIGGDLRNSSPRIMNAVAAACEHYKMAALNLGHIPSPAVALYGITHHIATVMVTGSHIPDDRNGMKFNLPIGEILQADEQAIRNQTIVMPELFTDEGMLLQSVDASKEHSSQAEKDYITRFTDFFPDNCLAGMTIGVYQHSAVARDILIDVLAALGADTLPLGRSDAFVSVDTEAIREEDVTLAKQWAAAHQLDAIVSTDGDSDRPLLSDEKGHWLRGDIVGLLTARYLQADIVVTPVSSNSSVDAGFFEQVERTRIGSPYVIAAMQSANQAYPTKKVVGYEANGGFLQQTTMALNDKSLSALPTRDAMMVIISVIMLAKQQGMTISQLNNSMPAIYTSSDRIKNFATEKSQQLLASLLPNNILDKTIVAALFPFMDDVLNTDITDGLRLMFAQDEIIHLRPSGNAPELRCYTEAKTESRAQDLNRLALTAVKNWSPQK